jgi:predicted nucleic-acid-binding protein
MIALDTNVIVRALTQDDPAQARRAGTLMRDNSLWVSKTVLLETEWVLRYTYEYDTTAINGALSKLVGLQNLTVEDAPGVELALEWHLAGMDFADALHLVSSGGAAKLATFDRRLARTAGRVRGAIPVDLLSG